MDRLRRISQYVLNHKPSIKLILFTYQCNVGVSKRTYAMSTVGIIYEIVRLHPNAIPYLQSRDI